MSDYKLDSDGNLIVSVTDGTDTVEVSADGALFTSGILTDGTDLLDVTSDGALNVTAALTDGAGNWLNINSDGNLTVQLTDGTDYSSLDSVEGALVQIPIEHHMVHEGKLFMMSGRTVDLGDGDSIDLVLSVPNTSTRIHAVGGFACATAGYAEFWEDATALLAGSTLTAYNADRNSANATSLTIYDEPASLTLAGASRLQTDQIGGGQQNRFGAEQRDNTEWILKQGSCYLTRYVSEAASNAVSFEIEYYEV